MLPQLVSKGFQVLFHSPPGVLFTFPSRYYSLSVTGSYLALGGGPPAFPPGFSCPVVLWSILVVVRNFVYGIVTLFDSPSQTIRLSLLLNLMKMSEPQMAVTIWFGLFPFRSPLLGESMFLSLPRGT